MLGMTVSGIAKAYSFSAIVEERVNNDHLAGTEALATFVPTSEGRAAFVRKIGNRVLNFEPEWVRDGVALMRDRETGTLWQALTGQTAEGELFSERLERLPSHY